jgi:hypothetical protein
MRRILKTSSFILGPSNVGRGRPSASLLAPLRARTCACQPAEEGLFIGTRVPPLRLFPFTAAAGSVAGSDPCHPTSVIRQAHLSRRSERNKKATYIKKTRKSRIKILLLHLRLLRSAGRTENRSVGVPPPGKRRAMTVASASHAKPAALIPMVGAYNPINNTNTPHTKEKTDDQDEQGPDA